MAILEWGPVELNWITGYTVREIVVNSPIMFLDGSVYLWTSDKSHRRITVEGVCKGVSDINLIRDHLTEEHVLELVYNNFGSAIITNFQWKVWRHKGYEIWYRYTIEFTTKE